MKLKTQFFTLSLLFLFSINSFAENLTPVKSTDKDIRKEYSEFKNHHLLDNHSFKLFKYSDGDKYKYISLPLPVILWDNGLQIFLSSKFYFGKEIVEHKGNYYKLYHNKIYKTDEIGTINYDSNGKVSNIKPYDFSVTKNVAFILICFVLMITVFGKMARSYKKNSIPTGLGRLLEPIVLYIRDDIARPNIGEKLSLIHI